MKKLLSIILTLLLLTTLIGCAEPADKKDESSKAQETLTVEKTESIKKNQADKQVTVAEGTAQKEVEEKAENPQPDVQNITEPEPVQSEVVSSKVDTTKEKTDTVVTPEKPVSSKTDVTVKEEPVNSKTETSQKIESKQQVVSKEQTSQQTTTSKVTQTTIKFNSDAEVAAEIAKHVKTDVEFKLNKQEIIEGKNFELSFYEFDKIQEKVVYKNDLGDDFSYYTDGTLFEAKMFSKVTTKTSESITKEQAQKIAEEYAKTKIDFDKYALEWNNEDAKGYYFRYTMLIGGYQSSNRFSVRVGYDGTIVYTYDFSNLYKGKNLDYTKEYIDNKIKEYADESKIDWDDINIGISDDKVCAVYTDDEAAAVYYLALE